MNNLQYIIRRDMRAAWHMAVELCEQGDFDSVAEAVRWLMRERDDVAIPSGVEYEIIRCRDCKFKAKDGEYCYRTEHDFVIEPDGFCAWGEQKESLKWAI